jgi:DNA (cytosine-5)-methyltransferase 1
MLLKSLEPHNPCISCGIKLREEEREELQQIPGGFTRYGAEYHVDDFIYILPYANDGVLEIAQITKIKDIFGDPHPLLSVRYFGRYDDYILEQRRTEPDLSRLIQDEASLSSFPEMPFLKSVHQRRLYLDNNTGKISPDRIDGLCFVQHLTDPGKIEDWVQHPDHFYVNHECEADGSLVPVDKVTFRFCKTCYRKRLENLHRAQMLKEKHGPLPGLELFSGKLVASSVVSSQL